MVREFVKGRGIFAVSRMLKQEKYATNGVPSCEKTPELLNPREQLNGSRNELHENMHHLRVRTPGA